MVIELTKKDAEAFIGLLDLAVKAGGLHAAQLAIPLVALVQNAAQQEEKAE
jgi:hypothetical protein